MSSNRRESSGLDPFRWKFRLRHASGLMGSADGNSAGAYETIKKEGAAALPAPMSSASAVVSLLNASPLITPASLAPRGAAKRKLGGSSSAAVAVASLGGATISSLSSSSLALPQTSLAAAAVLQQQAAVQAAVAAASPQTAAASASPGIAKKNFFFAEVVLENKCAGKGMLFFALMNRGEGEREREIYGVRFVARNYFCKCVKALFSSMLGEFRGIPLHRMGFRELNLTKILGSVG